MTVALGNVAEFAGFTTASPVSIEFTPAATARGIEVAIVQTDATDDQITSVTVEGVAMARVDSATDTVTELARVYWYHLSGTFTNGVALTIEITHTGTVNPKWATVHSVTAGAATEIITTGKLEANQANPQIALDTGATESLRMSILFSGDASPAALTPLAGMEAHSAATNHDFGINVALVGRQTTASTGSFTIGYTVGTDDVAMVAVAIQEVSAGTTVTPAVIAVTASLPTPAVLAASIVTPAAVAAVAALPTPSILAASKVTPATVAAVAALPTPSILAASRVTPATIAAITALPTPTIIVDGGPAVVTPATISVLAAVPTPLILAAVRVTPVAIIVSVTLPTPVASVGALVLPTTISLVVALPTPTLLAASTVNPATIALLVGLPTPLILIPATVTPATIDLIVGLLTPLIIVAVPTFWQPAPVVYTLNPAAYVPVRAGDDPPW